MKKIVLFLAPILILAACSNGGDQKKSAASNEADSVYNQVMKDHDIAMPQSMKMEAAQKKVQAMLDSIGKLPAAAQKTAMGLKSRLDSLVKDMSYASTAMEKWMMEFEPDSFATDQAKRLQYLTEEKLKIGTVKEKIREALSSADSLIKK